MSHECDLIKDFQNLAESADEKSYLIGNCFRIKSQSRAREPLLFFKPPEIK